MASEAESERRLLIVVEPREFLRGCLRCWLDSFCQEFEALMVGDIEASLPEDVLRRAGAVLISAHARLQPRAWVEHQIQRLRSQREDLPIIIAMDSDDLARAAQWSVQGSLPLSSSIDVAAAAIRLVVAGGTYHPYARNRAENAGSPVPHEAVPAGGPPSAAILTPREKAVLTLLERGLPNKAIAQELNMSIGTVKVHVHNIMAKFKVRNRTAAALASQAMWNGRQPSGLAVLAAVGSVIRPATGNPAEL